MAGEAAERGAALYFDDEDDQEVGGSDGRVGSSAGVSQLRARVAQEAEGARLRAALAALDALERRRVVALAIESEAIEDVLAAVVAAVRHLAEREGCSPREFLYGVERRPERSYVLGADLGLPERERATAPPHEFGMERLHAIVPLGDAAAFGIGSGALRIASKLRDRGVAAVWAHLHHGRVTREALEDALHEAAEERSRDVGDEVFRGVRNLRVLAIDARPASALPYEIAGRVIGRSADAEHLYLRYGSHVVSVERYCFSDVPADGERVLIERDAESGAIEALTERQVLARGSSCEPEIAGMER